MLLYLCVLSSLSTASPMSPPSPVDPPSPEDPPSPIDHPSPGYPLSQVAAPIPCPSSWYDSGLSGLGCLLFHTSTTLTWEGANSFCQAKGGALVEVWTEDQHEALRMVLGLVEDHDTSAR